ncbi:MAG: zf-HC2 domain-containing protein [Capsulimonadales bacterium]|nr:zf-HC2 domain-containing protein [Capsulimonadales bacterium]
MKQVSRLGDEVCAEIRPLLSVVADGEASTEETGRVNAHLSGCAACASHFAFLQAMDSAFRNIPREAASAAGYERIRMATFARPSLGERLRGWLAPNGLAMGVGTVAVVGILSFVLLRVNAPTAPTADPPEMAQQTASPTPAAIPSAIPAPVPVADPTPTVSIAAVPTVPTVPTVKPDRKNPTIARRENRSAPAGSASQPVIRPVIRKPVLVASSSASSSTKSTGRKRTAEKSVGAPTVRPVRMVAKSVPNPVANPVANPVRRSLKPMARMNTLAAVNRSAETPVVAAPEPRTAAIESTPVAAASSGPVRIARVDRNVVPAAGVTNANDGFRLAGAGTNARNLPRDLDLGGLQVRSVAANKTSATLVTAPLDSPTPTARR